ncbi:MAG: hypothetical protein F4X91_04165 [Nitrospinae bacterium]|nr:hypothetical protein [Nitrospinota bacterium]
MDFNHTLRVLVVREDGMWCAIALDMSLRGYGETQDQAVESLTEAVEAQLSFAVQHDTLDDIFVPAEPSYHALYESVKRDSVKRPLKSKPPQSLPDIFSCDLPLPQVNPQKFVRV